MIGPHERPELKKAYNPNRDLARIWPALIQPAMLRAFSGDGVGGRHLKDHPVSDEAQKAGMAAFKKVLDAIQAPEKGVTIGTVVEDSAIMKQDKNLLLAVFASIGASLISATYAATNDLLDHESPPLSERDYRKLLDEINGPILK